MTRAEIEMTLGTTLLAYEAEVRRREISASPPTPTGKARLLLQFIEAAEMLPALAALDARPVDRLSPDDTLDIYVPGVWRCPQCEFQLVRSTLFVASGEVGVSRKDIEEPEPCPNDGALMVRLTWRERALDGEKRLIDTMERLMRVTNTEHWPGALDAIEQRFRDARPVEPPAAGWIVVIGRHEWSWAKCYGPFASYDAVMAWVRANQFDVEDAHAYPVNRAHAPTTEPAR